MSRAPVAVVSSGAKSLLDLPTTLEMLEALGVPFLALHKENLKSPDRMDFFAELYRTRRGPFTGRRILVYNEIERVVQTKAQIIAPDRVTICGMPRLGRVHAWRISSAVYRPMPRLPPRMIVFLPLSPRSMLPPQACWPQP
jgi:hypothetical protein